MEVKTELDTFKILRAAIKKQEILHAVVKVAQVNQKTQMEELVLDINGIRGIIPKNEIDMDFTFKSLIAFVGTTVPFIPMSIAKDKSFVTCSRALAQKKVAPEIMSRLMDGECFEGTIINILPYGAYVEVEGIVGLLKNTDFAEDYTSIKEMHRVGSRLNIKMKGKSKTGKLLFEAVKKYVSPTVISQESLQPNQIILGVVRNIQPWGIFVNIAPNLDALVDSDLLDISEDQKVSIRIKSAQWDGDRFKVRGKIVGIL